MGAAAAIGVAAALGVPGAAPAQDTPAPSSLMGVALDALSLTADDLAQPTHLMPADAWRLPVVERLLRRPLQAVSVVRGLALRLSEPPVTLADRVRLGAEALGLDLKAQDPSPPADLEALLLDARRRAGLPPAPRDAARIRRAVAALPAPVREGAARILAAQRQAAESLRTASGAIGEGERRELLAWLHGIVQGRFDPDDPVHRRALDLAGRIDRAVVFAAARLVADAVDQALPDLVRGGRDPAVSRRAGAILLDEPTPWGRVVIAGAGPNVHTRDALLLIDLGGDDEYTNNAGGTAGRLGGIAVAIDVAGNDRYRTTRDMVQGAGIFGVGLLVDVAGDDVYEAGGFAQGAGVFGVGLLADLAGDDRYTGRALVQGASAFGIGLLADAAGNDRYQATAMAQAFGFVAGLGALIEGAGNDVYTIAGGPADPRQAGHAQSFGQGMGLGIRSHAGGGIGVLVDRAGHDAYRGDYFAQGVGFWFALGGLVDEAGDDRYAATRYAQGAGVHLAVGVLADAAGDDQYEAQSVAQGVGHDWAVGILADVGGDDQYRAVGLAQGAGSSNGVGLLADIRGRDGLTVPGPTVQGCGVPSRGYPSIGLLLTRDAAILGLPVIDGKASRRCGDMGLTLSSLGLPTGLPWDPTPHPDPALGPGQAEAAGPPPSRPVKIPGRSPSEWPPHSEKMMGLLRQAADAAESGEADMRRRAARRALLADPGALPVLLAALELEDPGIVSAALDLLVAMGAPAARPAADLLDSVDPRLRRRAAWVLKGVASLEVRAQVLYAARRSADPVVRAYALEGLRPWAGGDEARAALVAALTGEAEWVARLGAARALEGADDADTLRALAAALGDAHFAVRAAARHALAAAGAAAQPALAGRAAEPAAPAGTAAMPANPDAPARPQEAIARRHARTLLQRLEGGGR